MKKTSQSTTSEEGEITFEVPKVLDRLKKHLNIRTNTELSDILEVKPNTISTWKKRNTLDYPRILSVCKTYSIDIDKIFFNKESDLGSPRNMNNTNSENAFSVVTGDMYFQYVYEAGKQEFIDSLPKFSFPFISGKKVRAFQVISSSMFPILKEGDYVVGEYIGKDIAKLINQNIYILISNLKGIYISRIQKDNSDPEVIHLVRDNQPNNNFFELEMTRSEIIEIWEVTSVFSLDLMGL
ncbi:LexA family transcriptional regulator [Sinomicrobium oceani]|uniref:LexA family transcriptional regulator n=1 Tax=Sinomicrobium oceani TaxID=1150368 RepID=UPI00227B926A|nr:helix-turn-helix domain-containing protein [Sinomicrobium oceani]